MIFLLFLVCTSVAREIRIENRFYLRATQVMNICSLFLITDCPPKFNEDQFGASFIMDLLPAVSRLSIIVSTLRL
jgi:hypothetical protein